MARISDLARLFSAIASRDWNRAQASAEAIVQGAEGAGHQSAALTLRRSLAPAGAPQAIPAEEPVTLMYAHRDFLTSLPTKSPLDDVEMPASLRKTIEEILREFRHRELLLAHGIQPRNRLLFHGPPGCGKTLTAQSIGYELKLPVFVLRFDALIGSLLGQTSLRVRDVFRFAEATPCVLLIDEIDAIGRVRGRPTDVGELDRIVISLMQHLDLVHPAGIIIAASNVPRDLDQALLRRFESVLKFAAPDKRRIRTFTYRRARSLGLPLNDQLRRVSESAKTYAEVDLAIAASLRRQILRGIKNG